MSDNISEAVRRRARSDLPDALPEHQDRLAEVLSRGDED